MKYRQTKQLSVCVIPKSAVILVVHTLNICSQQWRLGQLKTIPFRNTNHNFYPFYWKMKVYISLPCSLCFLVFSILLSEYNGGGTIDKKKDLDPLCYTHTIFTRVETGLAGPLLEHLAVLCRTFESASFLLNANYSVIQDGNIKQRASLCYLF